MNGIKRLGGRMTERGRQPGEGVHALVHDRGGERMNFWLVYKKTNACSVQNVCVFCIHRDVCLAEYDEARKAVNEAENGQGEWDD